MFSLSISDDFLLVVWIDGSIIKGSISEIKKGIIKLCDFNKMLLGCPSHTGYPQTQVLWPKACTIVRVSLYCRCDLLSSVSCENSCVIIVDK